ncbi:MAG: hypothetical protein FWC62_01205 [Firmicutes bacterium]|nr:hypothetical protein [Bacillota bacterium]
MNEYPSLSEIPIGLGMALMQNKNAADYFATLSAEARQRVIDHTHSIRSREEMRAFVDSLPENF